MSSGPIVSPARMSGGGTACSGSTEGGGTGIVSSLPRGAAGDDGSAELQAASARLAATRSGQVVRMASPEPSSARVTSASGWLLGTVTGRRPSRQGREGAFVVSHVEDPVAEREPDEDVDERGLPPCLECGRCCTGPPGWVTLAWNDLEGLGADEFERLTRDF